MKKNVDLTEWLADLRRRILASGLSDRKLAELAGVSGRTIGYIKRGNVDGKPSPTVATLQRISDALNEKGKRNADT